MFRCIIFDLDGTLVDTELLNARAFIELVSSLDLTIEAFRDAYRGWKLNDIICHLSQTHDISLLEDFTLSYRCRVEELYRRELRAFDGVVEALEAIKVPMCVASNAPRQKITTVLEITGLSAFFGPRIFSAYDIGAWKPDPRLFIASASAMNVLPHECLVVEDSHPGVQAATAAGMRCIKFQPELGPSDPEEARFQTYSEFNPALEALSRGDDFRPRVNPQTKEGGKISGST